MKQWELLLSNKTAVKEINKQRECLKENANTNNIAVKDTSSVLIPSSTTASAKNDR